MIKVKPKSNIPVVNNTTNNPPKIKLKKEKNQFTGKNVNIIKDQVSDYVKQRADCEFLERTILTDYYDDKEIENPQIKSIAFIGRQNGPENYFKGKIIRGRIEFNDAYPEKPPKVYMDKLSNGKVWESMNIYATGEVCHFMLNETWWKYPKFSLANIMRELEKLWYTPNPKDPANFDMERLFEQSEEKYWDLQRKQSQYMEDYD